MADYNLDNVVAAMGLTEEQKKQIIEQSIREEREEIVDQALTFIENIYVHYPLKRARNAIDPVQRLQLLKYRLVKMNELNFQREMIGIFTELRDLHTVYMPPMPYQSINFVLPFTIEEFYENNQRYYIVSHVNEDFQHESLEKGVIVTHWNGIPIERAIELNGLRTYESNEHARRSRSLNSMTLRSGSKYLVPDEQWLYISYITKNQEHYEHRFQWQTWNLPETQAQTNDRAVPNLKAYGSLGIDFEAAKLQKIKKSLFASAAKQDNQRFDETDFQWSICSTTYGEFGYIRIHSFMIYDRQKFIQDLIRVLEQLPRDGLIIDVRGNSGGYIEAGEMILQLFTANKIQPELFQFINTPTTCKIAPEPWKSSIERSIDTGAVYSSAYPISGYSYYIDEINQYGQKYFGPVILITDALSYSTTDIFAAGFQDHNIGSILGTSECTGAGGANVWEYYDLFHPNGFSPLPRNAQIRMAVKRAIRVGNQNGLPLEDSGVIPDYIHNMTRNDVLNGNVDLIEKAAAILANMKGLHHLPLEVF
jgi:C-terminal processing protease CtpA/Prc